MLRSVTGAFKSHQLLSHNLMVVFRMMTEVVLVVVMTVVVEVV